MAQVLSRRIVRRFPIQAMPLLALLLGGPGCQEEVKAQLYFPELRATLGPGKVNVVSDVSLNPEGGGDVTVITEVEPEVDRDELDKLMASFLRQVKERRGFRVAGPPKRIDLRFYVSEAKAKAGGEDWLAQVLASSGAEPTMTNRQKPPLLKWTKKVLGPQPEFSGTIKPQILADPITYSVELTIPYVNDDGSGTYVEKLTYVKAITEWVSYTRALFEKIPELKKFSFVGKHNDQPVMKIWLTRQQYQELDLQQVEESLGAFQGQFIEPIMSKLISEKAVEKKVVAQRQKVYRETLGRLPAEQVQLAKELK